MTDEIQCDVLIVGGGPAGSSVAWGLRDGDLDVAVLDRKEFPRNKICAGWVTPQILSELEIEEDEYRATGRIIQPIHGFSVQRIGSPEAVIDHGETVSYGIRRFEFDHYLIERCGARLLLGEPIQELRRTDDGWLVTTASHEVRARSLVGAGGHFCPVARKLGVSPGRGEPTIVATEIEFEMTDAQMADCRIRAEVPELYFSADLQGYGWAVRKGERWLNVGVGRVDTGSFPKHVQAFVEWLGDQQRVPADLPRMHGHAYLLYDQAPRPFSAEHALLVGDSAGLAYNPSGEGIRPAVESGLIAARLIDEAGAITNDVRAAYETLMVERFGKRHGRPRGGATQWIPKPWRGAIAGRIMGMPWFARNVIIDRWFLHRHDPPLTP